MRCPVCSETEDRVIDSRLAADGAEIRRRRECRECGHRFTTRERVEETFPRIKKRDGRSEAYDRAKLRASIAKAFAKRPLSGEVLDRILERLERGLQGGGEPEVESRTLGERVIEALLPVDPTAATRFASVFHDFQSPRDYEEFIRKLPPEAPPDAPPDPDG